MTHVAWSHDGYVSAQADDSRQAITPTSSNWVGVLATWYMDRRDSIRSRRTPRRRTDEAVVARDPAPPLPRVQGDAEASRGRQRRVLARDDSPVGHGPRFSSYDAFVAHEAQLAQANAVDLLDVGTELVTMSDFHFAGQWATVIGHVRGPPTTGPLTYGANANSPGDEFTSVSFWSQPRLRGPRRVRTAHRPRRPDRGRAGEAWSGNMNGDDMLAAYSNWQAGHGKPVLFTEIGYRSAGRGPTARPGTSP